MRRPWRCVAALAVLCLTPLATPAAAQMITGLFYQEVEKDGRVYVFNTAERFKAFSGGGEIGTAITLVGRAEGGKTLVAENETAADLYFFKHNLPGFDRPTPKPYAPPFTVDWKDGKTTITAKSAQLVISNRMQVRYTSEDLDTPSAQGIAAPERDTFRLRRMRTKFDGWAYTKDLTYELQFDTAAQTNLLQDANLSYDFTKGKKAFMLKAGQYKVPLGRQELTSSGSQQFVDRSIVSAAFARGRDIGVQLWGTPNNSQIDWRVGVFNGAGRTVERNDNDDLQINARVAWQPFGDVKYSESDFDSAGTPLFAVAASYEANEFPIAAAGTTPAHADDRTIVALDAVFKYKGFSVFAEQFDREHDRDAGLSDFDDEGLHAQIGYFVIPARLEVALRWAEFDPNSDVGNNEREETGFGFGYFWSKHNHKIQADYRMIENKASKTEDKEIRIQYQLIF